MNRPIATSVLLLPVLLLVSCAKEIYTDAEAAAAKREAQKVGLTVLLRDINHPLSDMSGFAVNCSQCGDEANAVTSSGGTADLMVVRGDAILQVKKEGYPAIMAIASIHPQETERTNTVVVIPVFSQMQESIEGTVSMSADPVSGAMVSIDVDMEEWMEVAFSGLSGELKHFRPQAVSYLAEGLMQPVQTDAKGAFRFKIPVTSGELTYTLRVHETLIGQDYYTGTSTVRTNGSHLRTVNIMIGL